MGLYSNYTRITNYNKIADRYITTQTQKPSEQKLYHMGQLFAVIEITTNWSQTSAVGQSIINTLVKNYYRQSNKNELINFENSLKKVNEKLVQLTQNGQTDWIGKINACLVLVKDNKVHISHTGKLAAYLLRNNKFLPVFQPDQSSTYNHPLKTFSSLTSGNLIKNDKLFFCTNSLFNYISKDNLKHILIEDDFFSSSNQITNALKSRNVTDTNALVIQMSEKPIEAPENSEVLYLDGNTSSFPKFSLDPEITKNISKSFLSAIDWTKKQTKSLAKFYKTKIAPESKKLFDKAKTSSEKFIKEATNPKPDSKTSTTKNTGDKNIKKISSPKVVHYTSKTHNFSFYYKKILDYINKYLRKLSSFIKNSFKPKNRSKTLVTIAAILLIILIANISYLTSSNVSKEQNQEISNQISDLETKKSDASLALLSDNQSQAKNIYSQIISEIDSIDFDILSDENKQKLETLKNDAQVDLDKLSGITRFKNSDPYLELSGNSLLALNDNLYIINKDTNQISILRSTLIKTLENIVQIPTADGNATYLSYIENSLVIYTSLNKIYSLNSDNNLTQLENESNSWKRAESMATYLDNIYLLNAPQNQIYKYSRNDDGKYSEAQEYNTNNINLENAVDMTIDGFIYTLNNNGSVTKISQGSETPFTLRGIPEPDTDLADPKKIFTTENIESIYILDSNRILVFDKDGNFQDQYIFGNISNITDFVVNTKSKELYIYADQSIYKFQLNS